MLALYLGTMIGTGLIGFLITFIVICLLVYLLLLIIDKSPLDGDIKSWFKLFVYVLVIIWLIIQLLSFVGVRVI